MKKIEKNFFEDNSKLRKEIHELENELKGVYKCLYPDFKNIMEDKYGVSDGLGCCYNFLAIMRDYHKKQLEKEKMKKLIKECMEEINKEKE